MTQMPMIEVRVKHFGEEIHAAVALHNEEIEQYIRDGVDQAMATIGRTIIEQAAAEATKSIHAEITNYFTWGDGGKAMRAAVQQALEPIAALLRAGLPRAEPTDEREDR
jgi:hypothetical protein